MYVVCGGDDEDGLFAGVQQNVIRGLGSDPVHGEEFGAYAHALRVYGVALNAESRAQYVHDRTSSAMCSR